MESIYQISSLLETARDLTLDAAQAASSSRTFSNRSAIRDVPFVQVKKLLDSRNDRDILDGLRRVISMMYRRKPCLPFFSSIVKNVASPNIEIKKLVYIYLLHYAESEPDLALLSINTIQKSLTDQNPQVRAMALRVMSGIRVPVISQIVSLAIKRGTGDMSPFVRKAAALAIPKCYRLAPNTLPQLLDCLSLLIGDKQYYVVGSAVSTFLEVCPDRMDLIHKHYRGLVRKLVDMDEWGQLATIKLLTLYVRKCFPFRTRKVGTGKEKGFYEDDTGEEDYSGMKVSVRILDPDLELFLNACRPLLSSRNSAVIVTVVRTFLHLGTPEYLASAVGPLIALLRSSPEIRLIVLHNIVSLCLLHPDLFVKYTTHFFIRATDPPSAWHLKIEIMTLVFPHCDPSLKSLILTELDHFTKSPDNDLVCESVRAIGRCAQHESQSSSRCLKLLLKQITNNNDDNLLAESLTVIRHLIQQNPSAHLTTVIKLAKNLDTIVNPFARANIIWLIGEFAGVEEDKNIAPDVLRILAPGFADESEAAKLQIVLLAAKVYVHHLNKVHSSKGGPKEAKSTKASDTESSIQADKNAWDETPRKPPESELEHPIVTLWNYVMLLAKYDTSYDLRDRVRLYKALVANPESTQLASLLLLAPKPVPHIPSPSAKYKDLLLGTATLVVGQDSGPNGLLGYQELPEWVKEGEEPDSKLRDELGTKTDYVDKRSIPAGDKLDLALREKTAKGSATGIGTGSKAKTLDDWLAEEEETKETEEETEETEEEDEDEDEDEGEEETSEEDESESDSD
ncbi:MAG: AP-3 complex subunit beta [Icmadophila ericetorum]|nr:AP-3 complex subunit beta [Icmadophila ericetorum]